MKRWSFAFFLVIFFASGLSAQNKVNVFPQVADGAFSDGSFYRTAFMILPAFTAANDITCTLRLQGLSLNLMGAGQSGSYNFTVPQGGFFLRISGADQGIATGFAVLTCSDFVFAQALYSYYASNGVKISEATVFSSDGDAASGIDYRMIADLRGSDIGIAIANDTDQPHTYRFTIKGLTQTVTVPARSSLAKFVTEVLPDSVNSVGILKIESLDFSPFYAIGLRFTGAAFTTIPAN